MGVTSPPPRKIKAIRMSDDEIADVQKIADRDGIVWTTAMRRMLAYAAIRMPKGWGRR